MPYRLEVTTNARRSCNGTKPCKGSKITKGECVFGTWVTFKETGSFKWRHLACMTPKVIQNLKNEIPDPTEVDGYDELPEPLQDKFKQYFEDEAIPDEDRPESAIPKSDDENAEDKEEDGAAGKKGKKGAKGAKGKKAAGDTDADEKEEKKPKKGSKKVKDDEEPTTSKRKPASKRKKAESDAESSALSDEEDKKPANKKAKTVKKEAPASKRSGRAVRERLRSPVYYGILIDRCETYILVDRPQARSL
ncbi:hypothetical protein HD553DRAFT_163268 [Filobasidium floriforme]|uniref:uncharacterized protein n=1 Tax=Filobasidium floriforme TaxID=5210 RepID=UPI001E8DA8C4|nr:uncharacterized protein HD553DRAFT_163268 [Filobasidium floriforme]KAH8089309.1 hypothetical protein HD553DRAFT_163268 [Filobasidium floriforme]